MEVMRDRMVDGKIDALVIFRCGAYVGEVTRRNSARPLHWIDREEAARFDSSIAEIHEGIGGSVLLWGGPQFVSFPLGKVIKFLQNGRGDSVNAFARATIARWNQSP